MLFVEQAGNDDSGRHSVEHGEDSDTDHELLQRVRLAASLETTRNNPYTDSRRLCQCRLVLHNTIDIGPNHDCAQMRFGEF